MKIRVWIGKSRIAGRGLFTAQDIKQGKRIIQYIGYKISKDEGSRRAHAGNAYIFELNDRSDIDGTPLKNTARYINHSCEPNCVVHKTSRTIWIVALRDITAGEELSYNYGCSIEDYEDHPCQCGSPHCCGYILAKQYWGVLKSR